MAELGFVPITDEREVHAFLDRVPLVVERERFTRFVLGFPRRYLESTPPVEIVRHFGLVATLGRSSAASSLAREGLLWKLIVVAADRSLLFSRISGSLSFFGANIVAAEAFGNTESLVVDTFTLADTEGRFSQPEEGRRFQGFLEDVIEGRFDLEGALDSRIGSLRTALALEWDDEAHPSATRLHVSGADAFGLLYGISRRLSEAGCNIEIAHIDTRAGQVQDAFFLTAQGAKLTPEVRGRIESALAGLGSADAAPSGS